MFFTGSFLTLLLAWSITGSPVEVRNSPIIIPLTSSLNFSNGTIDLVQHDKARVAAFRDYNRHGRRASVPMLHAPIGKYVVAFGVGSPPTNYKLLVDSGSAVTWIGARTPYDENGFNTRQRVVATYGGGPFPEISFSGTFFLDNITLSHELTMPNYELAVASTVSEFIGYDGVLGIGPRDLTRGTLEDNADATYPTFTDCLVTAGVIDQNVVGIFFQPITRDKDTTYFGQLALGEPDYTKCTSNIEYTHVTNTPPSMDYWGIDKRITYGNTDIDILFPSAGIIDTGSSFIHIASDAYERYQDVTGAAFDELAGLLRITSDQYSALQDLKFHIGNQILSFIPNAQIWPRSLNSKIRGAEDDGIYLIIQSTDMEPGEGLDFVIGYTFLQRFYTVLDRENRGVGFATTSFTYATIN
ncbi:family A1 protease [Suillus spraguei]|nr:family A1 protease [Suillus spraguei]